MTQEINPKTGKKYYYKDNPESVKKRKESQMWVNGKYIPMAHPLHKPGRYSNFNDAAFTSLQKDVKVKEGYVYAISNPAWPDWIKIGMAIDAEDRLNGYQTSSPMRDYKLIHSVSSQDRGKAERVAHKAAALCGERQGEWFKITGEEAIVILEHIKESEDEISKA
tara:strand:- start:432 stop:926 length:495 start_codon:yes stop_codon:yes gene_type:complete